MDTIDIFLTEIQIDRKTNLKLKFSVIYRNKTVADKLMFIPNDDIQNYPFCRLQLVVETLGHSP